MVELRREATFAVLPTAHRVDELFRPRFFYVEVNALNTRSHRASTSAGQRF